MKERDLFTEALARSPGVERAAFLDQSCESDTALRARVERLLALHEVQDSLLDRSPVEALTYPGRMPPLAMVMKTVSVEAGLVIASRYTLTEKLGEGGMGEVWAAQQTEPVHRLVAVKMIRNGDKSRAVVTRFEQERQALAVLDHPNIARVFDGGATPNGQPFSPWSWSAVRRSTVTAMITPSPYSNVWSYSFRSAGPCNMPTRRGSFTVT